MVTKASIRTPKLDPRIDFIIKLQEGDSVTLAAQESEGVMVNKDGVYNASRSLEDSYLGECLGFLRSGGKKVDAREVFRPYTVLTIRHKKRATLRNPLN